MAQPTKIEWTDATWNPTRGCSRVSPGCQNCYAERQAIRQKDNGYKGLVTIANGHPVWTGVVRAITGDTLDQPLHWRKPRRIFVNSMSDLFHEALPDEAIDRVFAVMALCQHTFQVLTKRAERMLAYCGSPETRRRVGIAIFHLAERLPTPKHGRAMPFVHRPDSTEEEPKMWADWPLPNVWLGVSTENQQYADKRIPFLLQTPAAVRFVSYEPALEPVDFTRIGPARCTNALTGHGCCDYGASLNWVIVGGESGPGARPLAITWARQTIEQCRAAGVPCFVKQLGSSVIAPIDDFPVHRRWQSSAHPEITGPILKDLKGGDPSEWPQDLRIREFPR